MRREKNSFILAMIVLLISISGCICSKNNPWCSLSTNIDDHFHPGINVGPSSLPPVAVDDSYNIIYEATTTLAVLTNDTDPQDATFTLDSYTAPSNGTLIDNGDGTLSYIPTSSFTGSDTFTYTIKNSFGQSDMASVALNILSYCNSYTQTATIPFTDAPMPYSPLPDGTNTAPYRLCTKAQVDAVAGDTSLWDTESYLLMSDIDLDNGGVNNGQFGDATTVFSGTFNGQGYTLSNFRFVDNTLNYVGFFGNINGAANISNVTVTTGGYWVDGNNYTGILIGRAQAGATLGNLHSVGTINHTGAGNNTGGLIGWLQTNLSYSTSISSITVSNGGDQVGGLVGLFDIGMLLSKCTSSGTITTLAGTGIVSGLVARNYAEIENSSSQYIISSEGSSTGGLVGTNATTGSITLSSSTGSITIGTGSGGAIGGLVGANSGGISKSYSTNNVASNSGQYIGGLVGSNSGTITSSYAYGEVLSNFNSGVGGIAGSNGMTVRDSHFKGSVRAGASWVGGVVGTNSGFVETSSSSAYVDSFVGLQAVGLIVGSNSGTITSSFVTSGSIGLGRYVGAMVGTNAGHIKNSWVQLDLDIENNMDNGFFIGRNITSSVVENCFAVGTASSSSGFIGGQGAFFTKNSFSLVDVNKSSGYVGGFLYSFGGSDAIDNTSFGNVYGKTTDVGGFVASIGNLGISTRSIVFGDVTGDSFRAGGFNGDWTGGTGTSELHFNDAYGNVFHGGNYGGGFIGRLNQPGLIENSRAFGNVYSIGAAGGGGGFAGTTSNVASVIRESEAYGNVYRLGTGANFGGFIGGMGTLATIERSFSRGNVMVSGTNGGGFVGSNVGSIINESYTTASITGGTGGGFVNTDTAGTYTDTFWDSTIGNPLNDSAGGAVAGITGDTTVNMKTQGTFDPPWDFVANWTMPQGVTPGQGYPQLRNNYACNAVYVGGAYSGAGTKADPIKICTAAQYNALVAASADWSKFISLEDNIDFAGATIGVIGTVGIPFSGTFYGQNHTLSNFVISQAGNDNIGVFGYLNGDCSGDHVGDGQVWALKIEGATIIGDNNVGGIVGAMGTARVVATKVISATVTGINNVGGLVGVLQNEWMRKDPLDSRLLDQGSLLLRNFSSANVNATGTDAGGLVGENKGYVKYNACEGSISGTNNVGGLVGNNTSTGQIAHSKAEMGSFTTGGAGEGGLVAVNSGTIQSSFSGNAVPGLVGANSGTISSSYYDSTLATSVSVGGTGLTTAQAQVEDNFPELNFHLFWILNASYPNLKLE